MRGIGSAGSGPEHTGPEHTGAKQLRPTLPAHSWIARGALWQPAEPAGVDDDQCAAIVEVKQAERAAFNAATRPYARVDGDFHAGMAAAHEAVRQYRLEHGTVPDAESGSDEDETISGPDETSSGPDETEPDPEPACGYDAAWHEEAEAIAAWLEQIGYR